MVYARESILSGLALDNIELQNLLAVKYYDDDEEAWADLPDEFRVQVNLQDQDPHPPRIVLLLVRECPKDQRRSSQSRAPSNSLWLKEQSKAAELEKEIASLREKMTQLEKRMDSKDVVLLQLLSRRANSSSSLLFENEASASQSQPNYLKIPSSAKSDAVIIEELQIPELKNSQSSVKQRCHHCQSEIIRDKYGSFGRSGMIRRPSPDSHPVSEAFGTRSKYPKRHS